MGTLIGPIGGPEVAALFSGAESARSQSKAALTSEAFFDESVVEWGRAALVATLLSLEETEATAFERSLARIRAAATEALSSDEPAYRVGVFGESGTGVIVVLGAGLLAMRPSPPDQFVLSDGQGMSELCDAVAAIDRGATFTVERLDARGSRAICYAAGAVSVFADDEWLEAGLSTPEFVAGHLGNWPWSV